ncbi:MAG: hypothetical protein ACK5SN_02175, partial [Gemmatimonas sp.]
MPTSLVVVLALAVALVALPPAPTRAQGTPPAAATVPRDSLVARLADLRRIHTPTGIELLEPVRIDGTTQWV